MKTPRWRSRNRFLFPGAVVAAVALAVAGLAAPALARPSAPAVQAAVAQGPGYPPPAGIYKSFTNCPLNNPLMHEVMPSTESGGGFAACVAGNAVTGSITLGWIISRYGFSAAYGTAAVLAAVALPYFLVVSHRVFATTGDTR